jgi:phosphopentomutase
MDDDKDENIELTMESSEELARNFELVKLAVQQCDIPYARVIAKHMRGHAAFQQTASVLNPAYSPKKNDLLKAQAEALNTFCCFVSELQAIGRLKEEIGEEEKARAEISAMFI